MLGETIRICRKANDMKQIELAKKTGMSIAYICEIEKGKKCHP